MYVCRKIKLCSFLLSKGFRYEKEDIDVTNPSRKIWLFADSKDLRNAIEEYYSCIPG